MKKKIFFLLLIFIFGVLFLEIASRFLLYVKSKATTKTQQRIAVIKEKGYVRLKPNFKHQDKNRNEKFSINSLGFRGREIAKIKSKNITRIITLGGSTTFGVGASDDEYTYPALLEKYLNERFSKKKPIEVINAGIPGAKSINLLNFLKAELLDLNPDILIIFSGWNDWNYFKVQGFQYVAYQSPLYLFNILLTDYSVFYSKLRNVITGYGALIKGERYIKRASNVLRQSYFAESLHQNIGDIIEFCQANHIEPFLLLPPPPLSVFKVKNKDLYMKRDPVFIENKKIMPLVHQKLKEIIFAIAKERRIDLINVNYLFNSIEFGDKYYFDTIHFLEAGNSTIAKGIARELLKNSLNLETAK